MKGHSCHHCRNKKLLVQPGSVYGMRECHRIPYLWQQKKFWTVLMGVLKYIFSYLPRLCVFIYFGNNPGNGRVDINQPPRNLCWSCLFYFSSSQSSPRKRMGIDFFSLSFFLFLFGALCALNIHMLLCTDGKTRLSSYSIREPGDEQNIVLRSKNQVLRGKELSAKKRG